MTGTVKDKNTSELIPFTNITFSIGNMVYRQFRANAEGKYSCTVYFDSLFTNKAVMEFGMTGYMNSIISDITFKKGDTITINTDLSSYGGIICIEPIICLETKNDRTCKLELTSEIVFCTPDTIIGIQREYWAYDKILNGIMHLKLYNQGIYSIDYRNLKNPEVIINCCVGKYTKKWNGIDFYLRCDCYDHSFELNKLKGRKVLKAKSGDLKGLVFYDCSKRPFIENNVN
ncbi:MAG: hypothetical protein V4667_12360 [Bacteroidota bacterium]